MTVILSFGDGMDLLPQRVTQNPMEGDRHQIELWDPNVCGYVNAADARRLAGAWAQIALELERLEALP